MSAEFQQSVAVASSFLSLRPVYAVFADISATLFFHIFPIFLWTTTGRSHSKVSEQMPYQHTKRLLNQRAPMRGSWSTL
jgi:hypothetical protein